MTKLNKNRVPKTKENGTTTNKAGEFKKAFQGKTIYTVEIDGKSMQVIEVGDALMELESELSSTQREAKEEMIKEIRCGNCGGKGFYKRSGSFEYPYQVYLCSYCSETLYIKESENLTNQGEERK